MKISPSILSADFSKLKDEILSIDNADLIHIDVMDGHFVPNISFGNCVIKSIRNITKTPFDVHLMISNPLKYIKSFVESGGDYISIHIECEDNISDCIKMIKDEGKLAGLVISPDTSPEDLIPYLDDIKIITVMSVYPGFGGQKFIESTFDKVKKIREYIGDRDILLSVDGGVCKDNIKALKESGANTVVMGTALFNCENRKEMIEEFQKV